MKLKPIALLLTLAGSVLFADTNVAQNITKMASQISGTEEHPCATCSSETLTTSMVQQINKKTRAITIKDEAGKINTFTAPAEVRNFNQIKVGDIITVKIASNIDIQVTRGALEGMGHSVKEDMTRAKLGDKPHTKLTKTTVDKAKVIDLDYKTKSVALESMHGIIKVTPNTPEQFRALRVGDIADVISSKTVEISVSAPTAVN
jgi:hypothetical protein